MKIVKNPKVGVKYIVVECKSDEDQVGAVGMFIDIFDTKEDGLVDGRMILDIRYKTVSRRRPLYWNYKGRNAWGFYGAKVTIL